MTTAYLWQLISESWPFSMGNGEQEPRHLAYKGPHVRISQAQSPLSEHIEALKLNPISRLHRYCWARSRSYMLLGQDLKTLQKTMGAGAGRQQERASLVVSGF